MVEWPPELREGSSLISFVPIDYFKFLGLCFDVGKICTDCTKKNIGVPEKLDRDSNTGNCKYYVFEKSIILLTNNGTFGNSCLHS